MATKKKNVKQGARATKDPTKDNWITPPYILEIIDRFYGKGTWVDAAPIGPIADSLSQTWAAERIYINPPFSQYEAWAKHGLASLTHYKQEQIWICHHGHDVKWFRFLLAKASAMVLIDHRVKFIDPVTRQPSENSAYGKCQTLLYIGWRPQVFMEAFSPLGYVTEVFPQKPKPPVERKKKIIEPTEEPAE